MGTPPERGVCEKNYKGISGIYIYRRTDDHSKSYIGLATCLTTRFVTHRWHVSASIKGGYSSSPLLDKGVIKYGWENFEIAILQIASSVSLKQLESYYLSHKPYYNLIFVNLEGNLSHSIETKNLISEKMTGENNPFFGKTHSHQSIKFMSETKIGENNPLFGKTHSQVTRDKIREANLGKTFLEENKFKLSQVKGTRINLFSLEGQLIESFTSSRRTPTEFFNCDKDTILKYARSHNIFKDKYILSLEPDAKGSINNIPQSKGFTIYVYSLNYQLLNTFTTATEAGLFFKSTRHTILKYSKSQGIFKGEYILSLKEILPK